MKFIYTEKIHMKQYQLLISKRESVSLKHCDDPKPLIEYLLI